MKNTEKHNNPKLSITGVSDADLKRNAFKTPEGYFENLTPRVMESVRSAKKTETSSTFDWKRILVPTISIAAILLIALLLINPTENATLDFETVLASLTIEELSEYADIEVSELVSYELVDYNQMALAEIPLTEEELIDYLYEDEIELNSIIDEIEI